MNKNIKLIINQQIVDITTKSVSFVITKQTSDFTDITKRTGSFSYTIKLPRTKINKTIFRFIDEIDVNNKFVINNNYDAQLYVNDNLILDGLFILREITDVNFEGNIVNRFGDIFTLLGAKKLNELGLPEIDFEGIMLPMLDDSNSEIVIYNSLKPTALNPSLGFDFLALTEAYKSPIRGLKDSTIDYRDFYRTSFVQYSNFGVDSGKTINQLNTFINQFSIDNFMPQVKLIAVINQLFNDIGYSVEIDNTLVADPNIIIPYTGSKSPKWNWLQLSRTSLSTTSNTVISENVTKVASGNEAGRYNLPAYATSKSLEMGLGNLSHQPRKDTRLSGQRTFIDKQFSDRKYLGSNLAYDYIAKYSLNVDKYDEFKVHYAATNSINYDFNNNYSFYAPPAQRAETGNRDTGQIYTAPVDGEYEFDLDINHNIEYYHHRRFGIPDIYYSFNSQTNQLVSHNPPLLNTDPSRILYSNDDLKINKGNIIDGYEGDGQVDNASWNYNNKEMFELGNMVVFYKGSEDLTSPDGDLLSTYQQTFNGNLGNQGVGQNVNRLRSAKRLMNINNENVIGFYHPMLRDLYNGGDTSNFETWVTNAESLLKNAQTFPITENDKFNYFGFGQDTSILNFENNITSNFEDLSGASDLTGWSQFNKYESPTKQLEYKLVKAFTGSGVSHELDNQTPGFRNSWVRVYPNKCSGNVKYKFKTKLAKGEQVRMYYVTTNQWRIIHKANNYNYSTPVGLLAGAMYQDGNSVFNFDDNNWSMTYADFWADEYKINNLSIRCVSDDLYTSKLPLANFLPDNIKQKDFLNDIIKSNNLYYEVEGNRVRLKSRKDFYSTQAQEDLTSRMSPVPTSITPLDNNRRYNFGYNTPENYDFSQFVDETNPLIQIDLGDNVYLNPDTVDLTSTIFKNTYDRPSFYREYFVYFIGRIFTDDNVYTLYQNDITVPSFQEGGDSRTNLLEANTTYSRANRLLYWVGDYFAEFNNPGHDKLVGNIPFKDIKIKQSVSNKGLLLNSNKQKLFQDQFLDLQDSSSFEWYAYIDELLFSRLDLSKPINIKNTLYYIQKIEQYNPLNIGLTKVVLLKL